MAFKQNIKTQEVKKEYPKLDVKEFIGELKGIMLEDSGKRKDGTPWNKYRIIFKQDNDKYPEKVFKNQFTPFNFPKSLKIEDMVNKKFYRVLYVQEPRKYGGNSFKINKILGVYMHNNPKDNNQGVVAYSSKEPLSKVTTPTIYKKEIVILPEEQQLWDNTEFEDEEGWLKIAEDSGIFDSEERARQVFAKLTEHIK